MDNEAFYLNWHFLCVRHYLLSAYPDLREIYHCETTYFQRNITDIFATKYTFFSKRPNFLPPSLCSFFKTCDIYVSQLELSSEKAEEMASIKQCSDKPVYSSTHRRPTRHPGQDDLRAVPARKPTLRSKLENEEVHDQATGDNSTTYHPTIKKIWSGAGGWLGSKRLHGMD